MGTLTGSTPAATYKALLHMPDTTTGLTASLQYIQDGDGTNTPIQVSTSAVAIDALTVTNLTVSSVTAPIAVGQGGTGASTATGARTNLGLAIGTDVQGYSAALASIAGLTTAADKMIYTTASNTYAVADLTSFARTLLDDTDASTARATLGVSIGSQVQAYDAGLASIAGLTTAADKMIYTTGSDTYAVADLTSFARTLLDDTTASAARTTLGVLYTPASSSSPGQLLLGEDSDNGTSNIILTAPSSLLTSRSVTFQDASGTIYVTGGTDVAVADGGTGSSTASGARTNLGLAIGTDVQAQSANLQDIADLTDPDADRLLFWDDSAGEYTHLTLGTNLSISDTTLNASGGSSLGYFRAKLSADQTLTTATTTKIQFDSETYDSAGDFDPTTNYRFTPTTAGKYLIILQVTYRPAASGVGQARIHLNGSLHAFTVTELNSSNVKTAVVFDIIDFNGSTDYVEGFGFQNSGGDADVDDTSIFAAHYIGA